MSQFGRRVDGPAGRRGVKRDSVVLAAGAVTLQATASVIVSDVSPAGAKLQGCHLPAIGQEVMLKIGHDEVFAAVAWSSHDQCGVTFDPPLAASCVAQLKEEADWMRVVGITR